jgi:hypothetical protein
MLKFGILKYQLLEKFSQIYKFELMIFCFDELSSVELEINLNSSTKVELSSVCPTCSKPLVGCSLFGYIKLSIVKLYYNKQLVVNYQLSYIAS